MYNKVSTDMNFVSREKAIAAMWKEKDIIRKSFHHRDGNEHFAFFDGPPTANGKPRETEIPDVFSLTSSRKKSRTERDKNRLPNAYVTFSTLKQSPFFLSVII